MPNANVHVGFRAPPPPRRTLLSQAAQARRGEVPALPVKEGDGGASAGGNGAGNGERAGGEGPRGPAVVGLGGAAEFRESELARNDQVHKPKVPRWFKGGK